ncbi:unnamed protein product [Eruca vesicaria subsp. sativa]|uniref:protein-serine/threonine phosphatase n=1 Tax=Eruca vesicaria subsp. sativa TaxID=29727 RepID=A0ABC8L6A2_ERUVS|nr:unnamed protein product [Eruca vesicaria subsp. sativa]
MANDQVIAINDSVHNLQLVLHDSINDQKQLFMVGTLISRSDYEDIITEQTIAKLCGYHLCRGSLPFESVLEDFARGSYIRTNSPKKHEEPSFGEIGFSSAVIVSNECSVLKLPPQRKHTSPIGESEKGDGEVLKEQTAVSPVQKQSRSSSASKTKDLKLPTQYKEASHSWGPGKEKTTVLPRKKTRLRKKPENLGKKVISVESHAYSCEDGGQILIAESYKGLNIHQDMRSSSSKTVANSCLKVSGSTKLSRLLLEPIRMMAMVIFFWLEAKISNQDVNSVSRLALAEACAMTLCQAAKAVSSGDLNAFDAATNTGIVVLPSTHQLEEEVSDAKIEEDMAEQESTLLKWPNEPGMPDFDLFDPDQSWFEGPTIGFSLTVSPLISVGEGISSEIKETIGGCLARSLPKVASDLMLPIPISDLELGLLGSKKQAFLVPWRQAPHGADLNA